MAIKRKWATFAKDTYKSNPKLFNTFGRFAAKAAAQKINDYYNGNTRKKQATSSRSADAQTDEVAQSAIGYGQHEAKRLFTKKRKLRKNTKRAMRKRVIKRKRKFFKKNVKRVLNANYPFQQTLINTVNGQGSNEDSQTMMIGLVGTSNKGNATQDNTVLARENDLVNILQQGGNAIGLVGEDRDKIVKLYLHGYQVEQNLVNNGSNLARVKVYRCVCKRSLPNAIINAASNNVDNPAAAEYDMFGYLFEKAPREQDALSKFIPATWTKIGVRPSDFPNFEKYFSVEKIDSYEMVAGSTLNFTEKFYIRQELNATKINGHWALAGITRIYLVVFQGPPSQTGTYPDYVYKHALTTGPLTMAQQVRYAWRYSDDSLRRLGANAIADTRKNVSILPYTDQYDVDGLDVATS